MKKEIAVDTLKPNSKNPRNISPSALLKLQQSIERDPEFMALRPIVIDEQNIILGGNQRYKAIQKIGMKTIPETWVVRALNLTPEQRKRFVVIDNGPEGASGTWDFEALMKDFDLPDLEALGIKFCESVKKLVPKDDDKNLQLGVTRKCLIVLCETTKQQEALFSELTKRGLSCRLSIM